MWLARRKARHVTDRRSSLCLRWVGKHLIPPCLTTGFNHERIQIILVVPSLQQAVHEKKRAYNGTNTAAGAASMSRMGQQNEDDEGGGNRGLWGFLLPARESKQIVFVADSLTIHPCLTMLLLFSPFICSDKG